MNMVCGVWGHNWVLQSYEDGTASWQIRSLRQGESPRRQVPHGRRRRAPLRALPRFSAPGACPTSGGSGPMNLICAAWGRNPAMQSDHGGTAPGRW